MTTTRVRFSVGGAYAGWLRGLDRLPEEAAREAETEWQVSTELLFDRSQQYAHILSGDMKATGRYDVQADGLTVVGEVVYGGAVAGTDTVVDYAWYEHQRGGDHAYLLRAFEAVQPLMRATLPDVWAAVVSSWR